MKKKTTLISVALSIIFLIGFQRPLNAQAKTEDKAYAKNIKIEVKVTKDVTDEVLENYVKIFNKYDVDLIFGKLKRNDKDEITSIAIKLTDEKGKTIKSKISRNAPIETQKIYLKMDDDKISDLGIYSSVDAEEKRTSQSDFLDRPKIIDEIEKTKILWVNAKKYHTQDLLDKTIVYENIKSDDGKIHITGSVLSKTEADNFFETEGLRKVNMLSFNDKGKVILFRIDNISLEISE